MNEPANEQGSTITRDAALQLIEARSYPIALQLLRNLVRDNPRDVDALMNMAYCLAQLGETQEAAEILQNVIELRPHHSPAETMLAKLRAGENVQKRRLFRSIEYFEAVLPESMSLKGFKWTTCPTCQSKMLAGALRCVHCGSRRWGVIFLQSAIGFMVIAAMLYALSYVIPPALVSEFIQNRIPKMTWTQAAIFIYAWLLSAAALTLGCLLLNWLDEAKTWHHEWQYDLIASILITPILVLTNAFVVASYATILSERALRGFLPFFGLSVVFVIVLQFILLYRFFGRGFWQTVALCFLYICFNGLLRAILFTPLFG